MATAIQCSTSRLAVLFAVCASACSGSAASIVATSDSGVAQGDAAIGNDASTGDDAATGDGAAIGDAGASDATADAKPSGGGKIPQPTGTCPDFTAGTITLNPAGIAPRAARVWMTDAAKTMHGPVLFYWYATGSSTNEVPYALGATLTAIQAAGGIVIAPTADPNAGQFNWYLVTTTKDDDLRVADEALACAQQKVGIDARHVHSMGMSAGALMTSQMSFRRSSYLASVATYSGGIDVAPAYQDPSNLFAAMIFYGGATDNVYNYDFQAASQRYKDKLVADGHFAFLCNHNMGHTIPAAASSVWTFFQAHAFGTNPSPYQHGLPAGFPAYCTL
jgi:predicted esterase